MDRRYYERLRAALFGNSPLNAWDVETLAGMKDRFIDDALDILREDLETVYDLEVEDYLEELEQEEPGGTDCEVR